LIQSDTYLGNSQIKRDGVVHNFTQAEVQEYVKCAKDPIYFALKYVKVIHPDKGLVPFKLYDYQKKMISHFNDNRFSIVLSSRQSGKTISTCAYMLHYALFNPEETIIILANKGAMASEILSRITLMLENIPFFLQPGCKVLNKRSVTFSNNSRIISAATSSSSVRGMSASLLYCDEFAFVQKASEFYTSTYPVISSGTKTKVIITSTANGVGNIFYKLWEGASQGINEFKPFRVDWWDVPGRDEKWKEQTIANTSEQQFRQEFANEFIGTDRTLIESNVLLGLKSKPPIETFSNGSGRIYEKPERDSFYIMTVDVSQGRGQDCSAFNIIKVESDKFTQVATFNDNKVSPLLFPNIIVKYGKMYNNALVVIENNGPGQVVCNSVYYDFEYENTFVESTVKQGGVGLTTTKKVKRIGTSNMKDIIEGNRLILNDADTIIELSYFEERGNSFAAADNYNDDLVMTLVIFSWFVSSSAFGDYEEIDIKKMIFESQMKEIEDELLDFGFISSNQTEDVINPEYQRMKDEMENWSKL
jgi:hypothetical protein